jgi:hypothetical protein
MMVRWLVLQLLWLPLCGCSSSQQVWVAHPHRSFAFWDGWDGHHASLPPARQIHYQSLKPKSAEEEKSKIEDRSAIERKEAELDGLPKYSREWVALRKQIDTEEDARMTKILVICRGCETANSDPDRIASSSH